MSNMPVTPRQQRASAAGSPRTTAAPMSERQQMALLMQMTSQDKPPTPPINAGEERRKSRQQRNERGETPLHIAAKKGDEEQVQRLLQQGISPDVTDFAGWTPLHEACSYGWYQIVQTLVSAGADVNARGLDDDTPLHDAAGTGNLLMVKYLVEHGADPAARNNVGKVPADFSSEHIYNYLVSVKESAAGVRAAHAARARDDPAKKGGGAGTAGDAKRPDPLADAESTKEAAPPAADKTAPGDAKDEGLGQLSSAAVTSTQEEASPAAGAVAARGTEADAAEASDEDASKRKKRKEEAPKDAAKVVQPQRGAAGRVLTGTKPPGPASKTGAVPLGKNSQGASAVKPSSGGAAPGRSTPGPAGKTAAAQAALQGKSTGASKGGGPAAASRSVDRKSPDDTAKANAGKEPMEVDGEETKTAETPGPKVPPLKIVIPGGVGGGGGGQAEGEGGAARGGGGKGRGGGPTLPYVMPCGGEPAASASASAAAAATDSNDSDDKRSAAGDEKVSSKQRVLRSHRAADDKEARVSPPPAAAAAAATASAPADPPAAAAPTTTSEESPASTSTSTTSTATATTSTSSTWSSTPSNELHPRKRKIRASREPAHKEPPHKEPPPETSARDAPGDAPPAPHANPYQQYIDIRRQVERRQKALFPVQPKPPQGFKEYLMNRGTYLLQRNIKPPPAAATPATLPAQMRDQYVKHEKERYNLKIQHIIEKEKLVLSVEQEILRVHGRAARALANQALPFSACTILRDEEVYNAITPEQEEKERNAQRSRYNGRLFLSWLQDVDDKWEKIKEGMVRRHHTEAETLHAVQKMQWEWKLKEFALCDYKSTPKIDPKHVPQVHVSDDFDLLPA